MGVRKSAIAVACVVLAGCNPGAQMARGLPAETDAFARRFIELVAKGDYQRAQSFIKPDVRLAHVDSGLMQMRGELKARVPTDLRVVAYQKQNRSGDRAHFITYEGRSGASWVLYEVRIAGPARAPIVEATHVQLRERSLGEENALTLKGKRPAHYLIALLAVIDVIFIVFTLVQIFRTPEISKLRWLLVSIFGFGTFQLNWTTGQGAFLPISIVLLGAGLLRSGTVGPWILQIGFPIGAILFHVRRQTVSTAPEQTVMVRE